jgi:SAM-dependent methyltransferase
MRKPPTEFDVSLYRDSNPDLRRLSDAELVSHFQSFGLLEGRQACSVGGRGDLAALIEPHDDVLEIGPFTTPLVHSKRVKYFDILDREQLLDRARRIGYPIGSNPVIDFVSPVGDLSIVAGTFDVVVSSHVIEHQPDLIRHLQDVARLLQPCGHYLMVIPDKRYCFDHFIPESTIARIIAAHLESRITHAVVSIVEHTVMLTHNDSQRHWVGDHGQPRWRDSKDWVMKGIREADEAMQRQQFVDVHAWQFTPHTFRATLGLLADVGLSPFAVEAVYPTLRGSPEFCAILRRPH